MKYHLNFTRKQLINYRNDLIDSIDYFKHSGQPYCELEQELLDVENSIKEKGWHNDNTFVTVMDFY